MEEQWVEEGRPRGTSYSSHKNYKKAKCIFRNVQQTAYEQYIKKWYDDLDESAECDIRLFWKIVKRNKHSEAQIYPEIHQKGKKCDTPESIAIGFMDYFKNMYTNKHSNFDCDTELYMESEYLNILEECTSNPDDLIGGSITESEVKDIIRTRKRKKSRGHDRIQQNQNLLYGGEILIRCLTSFFNSIIRKDSVPVDWKSGLLIHCIKGIISRKRTLIVTDLLLFCQAYQKYLNKLLKIVYIVFWKDPLLKSSTTRFPEDPQLPNSIL